MKKILVACLYSFIIFSCNGPTNQLKKDTDLNNNGFILNGSLKTFISDKVYLSKIAENEIQPIDSAIIKNNNFVFTGRVDFPERFALTFKNSSAEIILIIENANFEILFDPNHPNEPVIKGSELNVQLEEYKLASKNIFKKIDYLFPKFQKARLENDVKKLNEIGNELKNIETEFTDFSFNFIKNNSDSYVAAMILSDQLKASNIDTVRISIAYKQLSETVKKSSDAQLITAAFDLR